MGEEAMMHHQDMPLSKAPTMTIDTKAARTNSQASTDVPGSPTHEETDYPTSPRNFQNPFSRAQTSLEMDDYFVGPRDMSKHSKWPMFMRMHGSISPEMILPLLFVAGWSTLITCLSKFVYPLGTSNLLLTVLGFVVGLGLSFRSSTAYERYAEGRKYWTQLTLSAQCLARVFWVHGAEREGEEGKQDLLAKMTALNLIVAFAVSLKHRLRFEPYSGYDDLAGLIGHLDTFAKEATNKETVLHQKSGTLKSIGEYLGVSFAESNPRKLLKKANKPLGNLPLEILTYLASYVDETIGNGLLKVPMQQTLAYNNIAALNDVLTGTDRILNTPLPVAYSIAISQITWVYIVILPFQLYDYLQWVTIPGTICAAYIILGLLLIGREIENPFGNDVNDLPLDHFCQQLASDVDTISSLKKPKIADFVTHKDNMVLFPISASGYEAWAVRSEKKIRKELKLKMEIGYAARLDLQGDQKGNVKAGDEKV
ncbi:hypothetical protein E2P81_ATG05522 [Venturia nashicola]|uniref:Uncharacterized protein n=1 Tax=Venturia nashicola TaxID=86259 RepID=A0A4Z1P8N6_9PEZI|nr:hypothetical protein E6O75_ATG05656 [Venturia nashicola]TLD32546.1 hypothetical protein E2P81_ATG05522 [Venturia nashicola]